MSERTNITFGDLKRILRTDRWSNLPDSSQAQLTNSDSIRKLAQKDVDLVNGRISIAIQDRCQIVYRTDISTNVLDCLNKRHFKLISVRDSPYVNADPNSRKTVDANLGPIGANLSLSDNFAFFHFTVGDQKFSKRFLVADLNTYPLIYEIPKVGLPSIIIAQNPYSNSIYIPKAA